MRRRNVAVEPDPLPPPGQWEANPRPVTVTVGPLTATLSAVGDTLRLTARVTDQYGQALTVPVAWSVDQPGVAAVDSAGLVTARSNGTAVVTATAGGVAGSGNGDGGAGAWGVTPSRIVISSVQRQFAREREPCGTS